MSLRTNLITICAVALFIVTLLVTNGVTRAFAAASTTGIRAKASDAININRDNRNKLLEQREIKKTEIEQKREDKKIVNENKKDNKNLAKKMRFDSFKIRHDQLLKELARSIENLESISARVTTRIANVKTEGRNPANAEALLIVAKEKIAKAKSDVAIFAAWTPAATSTSAHSASTTTASTEIDLMKPRELGNTAIKSVRDARESLKLVIVAIAHSMGLKMNPGEHNTHDMHATSTATTTSTITASSTASTTTSN